MTGVVERAPLPPHGECFLLHDLAALDKLKGMDVDLGEMRDYFGSQVRVPRGRAVADDVAAARRRDAADRLACVVPRDSPSSPPNETPNEKRNEPTHRRSRSTSDLRATTRSGSSRPPRLASRCSCTSCCASSRPRRPPPRRRLVFSLSLPPHVDPRP